MPEYLSADAAAARLRALSTDFVRVDLAPGQFPPFELLPLAPCHAWCHGQPAAILVDMDGTTTTTEDLCLDALDHMLERFARPGVDLRLDPARDYPHIIGTSATCNVSYLAGLHRAAFDPVRAAAAVLRAVAWTLARCAVPGRADEARATLGLLGVPPRADADWAALDGPDAPPDPFAPDLAARLADAGPAVWTAAGLEVYYHSLHGNFADIAAGDGGAVARRVFGRDGHAIVPLPGIGALFAIARGWLGADAAALAPELCAAITDPPPVTEAAARLADLGRRFAAAPCPVALVTSSAAPEADIVLNEVFGQLREAAGEWPVSPAARDRVADGFAHPRSFYAAYVTATGCHEARLKPHRDLYTLALQLLGIEGADRDRVIGFEDTEAGILAQRAAGVGVPVAVPFHGTQGHCFDVAARICRDGVPEALARHGLFLRPRAPGQPSAPASVTGGTG